MVAVVYAAAAGDRDTLVSLARDFSPRIDVCGEREVVLDASGLSRLFGDARTLGQELGRAAAERGVHVRMAIAGTTTAARCLVHHRAGLTIVEPGTEAAVLAPLPLRLLQIFDTGSAQPDQARGAQLVATLRRWGLRTLGDLVALSPSALTARLGQDGVRWQRLARGEDARPLVPAVPEEPFEQALDLEWPIEGLEPLSFVIGRLMEPLAAHLERRDRGAAVLRVRLRLVTREVHERSIELPSALRDARTLRTLAMLDLESHPPTAAIDRVMVAVDPTPARVLQFSLLTRPIPAPEELSTLLARLQAVMGEGRCGSPAQVDSWAPDACALTPFAPVDVPPALPVQLPSHEVVTSHEPGVSSREPVVALRRFRHPVAARVRTDAGRPVHLLADRGGVSGGAVIMSAGPWRTSGGWWYSPDPKAWDRDEWEVTLEGGVSYRLFRERTRDGWFVDAVID